MLRLKNNNIIIYATIFLLILGGIFKMKSNGTYKPLELKIGYGYFDSLTKLDPANIQTIYESNLIENLFSSDL